MKLIHRIIIGFGVGIAVICLAAILLFNWSVTGWKALAVPTGSMRPSINPGSLVLVHSVPDSSLKVGDVITYAGSSAKAKTITHRITKAYSISGKVPAFVTKGDANPTADRPIVAGQVQGKVIVAIPYVGTWLNWTHTLVGILIAIYIPALIIMVQEMRRLMAYYRQFIPYKTALILAREKERAAGKPKYAAAVGLSAILLLGSIFISFPVYALIHSNTVALSPNTLSVEPQNNGGGGTNCTSNNNVNVNNTTSQTATTGNANNSGNTTGGSATSGDATNTNNSSTTIIINGCKAL